MPATKITTKAKAKVIPKIDPDEFARRLIAVATDFIGMEEVINNKVWNDPRTKGNDADKQVWLSTWMRKVQGWTPGAPYCAAFVGAVVAAVLYGYGYSMEQIKARWLRHWTAHCMTNVRTLNAMKLLSAKPAVGALFLMRHGKTDSGHAGLVALVTGSGLRMTTVEGNTTDSGAREGGGKGDGIFFKEGSPGGRGSLATQGFLPPRSILKLVEG